MADLVKLKRSRSSCKVWVQREVRKLQAAIEIKEPDVTEVALAISEFDKRLLNWDAAQQALEVELDEEQLEADILQAGEFRDQCLAVKVKASKLLSSTDNTSVCSDSVGNFSHGGGSRAVKLPKIELPKFAGNVLEWPKFWDSFSSCVDASDISDIQKLTYLI